MVRAPPVIVPLVAVTETVCPLPKELTVLPELSVTLTLALKLPEAVSPVPVQVNRQGEESVPWLTVAFAQAILVAAAGLTVTARPAPFEIVPSLTVIEAEPAVTSTSAPLLAPETGATPLLKPIAVAVPKLVWVPAELATVAWAPEGLSETGPKVRLWEPL